MDEHMFAKWKARVKTDDTVFFIGDFAFGGVEALRKVRKRLPGRIVFILGNHDPKQRIRKILRVGDVITMGLSYGKFDLVHKPPPGAKRVHLVGHVHELWKTNGNCINVGVDVRNFEPKTLQELINDSNKSIPSLRF
jgi:calcineurin-like phosphoesterase family protein